MSGRSPEIDAIPGVVESAVIGIAHSDFGEAVTAVVVPTADAKLDEKAVQAQSFKFWEAPHWKRRDGSVTNW